MKSLLRHAEDRQLQKHASTVESAFGRLYAVIKRLRAPDGCPWDKEQTPETMRGDLLEECYEAVEAIDEKNSGHICEELGDVFLNTAMIAYMHEQSGAFSAKDALNQVADKIIRRHPHVFAGNKNGIKTSDQVLEQWDAIKSGVEGRTKKSLMDEVSAGLPPLKRAQKIQKKAAKTGFDWPDIVGVWGKVNEEIAELKDAAETVTCAERFSENTVKSCIEDELGDLLFSVVNLARHYGVDAEQALIHANTKFINRYTFMEQQSTAAGFDFASLSSAEKEKWWKKAKEAGIQ